MATSALPHPGDRPRPSLTVDAAAGAAYGLGAVALAVEAAIHVQQFIVLFDDVRWIGPLFIVNAAAIVVVLAGLAFAPTRVLAALAGVLISALALGSLAISYGTGLFGWQESGLRAPTAIAIAAEVVAMVLLTAGLAVRRQAERP